MTNKDNPSIMTNDENTNIEDLNIDDINGYPTILIKKDGKMNEYMGNRDYDSLYYNLSNL